MHLFLVPSPPLHPLHPITLPLQHVFILCFSLIRSRLCLFLLGPLHVALLLFPPLHILPVTLLI